MKKILNLIVKEPISTIQGLLYGLVGVLSYYEVISTEEGSLWVMFLLAVFRIFSRDNAPVPSKKLKNRISDIDVGGGVLVSPPPKKTK
jgi:hypothetical protein